MIVTFRQVVRTACNLGVCAPLCVAFGCGRQTTSIGEWKPAATLRFEAEEGELDGFLVQSDATAGGDAFIQPEIDEAAEDEPGTARARYAFSLPYSLTMTFWGRIRSPDVNTNRLWVKVDDGAWYKWRITVGDVWYWDDFHDNTDYGHALQFELDAGDHELFLANCVGGVALDQLFLSSDSDPNEGERLCNPPHSVELGGKCFPSCGGQQGNDCGAEACAGKTLLESYDCDVCCKTSP